MGGCYEGSPIQVAPSFHHRAVIGSETFSPTSCPTPVPCSCLKCIPGVFGAGAVSAPVIVASAHAAAFVGTGAGTHGQRHSSPHPPALTGDLGVPLCFACSAQYCLALGFMDACSHAHTSICRPMQHATHMHVVASSRPHAPHQHPPTRLPPFHPRLPSIVCRGLLPISGGAIHPSIILTPGASSHSEH